MYCHRALVSVTLLWLLSHTLTKDALAIAPHGTTITAFNHTQGKSILNLALSEGHLNRTLVPAQNFVSYQVPDSPVTLLFHSFGATIPVDKLLQTVALAVSICFNILGEGRGEVPIANGLFMYTREFSDHDIEITVGDFREIDRPMTYHALFDVVRGVGEFMIMPGQKAQELEFEVELQGTGYVGSGHVDYKRHETPASSIA